MSARQRDLDGLYEALARFNWWRRRLGKLADGEGLELRKRLLPPSGDGPADHAAGLDRWLQWLIPVPQMPRILDLGCGFGASLLRWVESTHGTGIGVTRSHVQQRRATTEAQRRGLQERCTFVVQDFTAPLPGSFDVVIAIESLAHASDLSEVLRAVHRALKPGGHFVWLDDALRPDAGQDADVLELSRRWSSPPLPELATRHSMLAAAGLRVLRTIDLTTQVASAPVQAKERRRRRLLRLRRYVPVPIARHLADAFLGGIALEDMYARGVAIYAVTTAVREDGVA
jgi:SAM-dependent methyltransferase